MKKRILSALMALSLCLSLLPATASDGGMGESTQRKHCICDATHANVGDHTEESVIEWTGISTGETLTVTREQTTAILYRYAQYEHGYNARRYGSAGI